MSLPLSQPPSKARDPKLYPLCWIGLAALVAAIDYVLGPFIQFPVVFILPVGLAAWFSGLAWGVGLAVVLSLVRLYFVSTWNVPWEFEYSVANAVIRITVLSGFAYLLDRTAKQDRALAERVQVLEGLLPICSGCKKIRDDEQVWHPLENYLHQHAGATFTHGFCEVCAKVYFGEFADDGS